MEHYGFMAIEQDQFEDTDAAHYHGQVVWNVWNDGGIFTLDSGEVVHIDGDYCSVFADGMTYTGDFIAKDSPQALEIIDVAEMADV